MQVYIHTRIDTKLNTTAAARARKLGVDKCDVINQALREGLMACKKPMKKVATKKATAKKK